MRQKIRGIFQISSNVRHPDIFLSITRYPNWLQIKRPILTVQTSVDNPDLTARLLGIKMSDLTWYVIVKNLFGNVLSHVRVVEFQKRGLTYAHFFFFLDNTQNIYLKRHEAIDEIILVKMPSSENPELRDLFLKKEKQNQFGAINPTSVCMKESSCTNRFPKYFNSESLRTYNAYYVTYCGRSPEDGG